VPCVWSSRTVLVAPQVATRYRGLGPSPVGFQFEAYSPARKRAQQFLGLLRLIGMQSTPAGRHGREIRHVALLDLTGAQAGAALEGVTRISHVSAILVPEALLSKLSQIELDHVATTVPVPDGVRPRVMAGQVVLGGDALAEKTEDMLVVGGQLIITSPVKQVGFKGGLVVMGQVIAPAGSEAALGAGMTRLSGQSVYYPYIEGGTTRLLTSASITGEALANINGQPADVLLATGQLVITSPIHNLGYQQITSISHLVVPASTEPDMLSRMTSVTGQVATYTAPPRVFDGSDHFSAGFFELFEQPITLVLDGKYSFDEDVTPDLLRRSVGAIVLDGKIRAPRRLIPVLQMLCIARDGKIESFDEPE